jgi:phenylalanyl-tRNA synthetase beta chain
MPIIAMSKRYLTRLLGREVSHSELNDAVARIGAEVDEYAGDEVNIEIPPNRSDMYSAEGLARALKGFLGIERGLPSYPLAKSDVILNVDDSVKDVRPYVVGGLAMGLALDDDSIKSLMDIQEKIHLTMGRNRKKVSIGIHDFDKVTPPFKYLAVEPRSRRFVPLAKTEEMDMEEILEKHEKGTEFAFLMESFARYPLIVDSKDEVLSFPPIINSALTTVEENTKNIFIDVTGTDPNLVRHALNHVASSMAELGASLQSIEVRSKDDQMTTPDLSPRRKKLSVGYANDILGLDLEPERIKDAFERMRFSFELSGDEISVEVPAYRNDILHPIDLVEDLAIGYGYENFEFSMPRVLAYGGVREVTEFADKYRDAMIGLGFQEIDTFTMGRSVEGFEGMPLTMPMTEDFCTLRSSLFPSLMQVLKANKRHELPQRIFEIGDVVIGSALSTKLGAATIHSKASFTEVKSYLEAVLKNLGPTFRDAKHPFFINGRCAALSVGKDVGEEMGILGEIHPRVITEYELGYPTAAFELDMSKLRQKIQ